MRASKRGQSALLLLDVIDILNKLNIAYAVIGALAVSFYGIVRASLDADAIIFMPKKRNSLARVKDNLTKLDLKVIIKQGNADDPLSGIMIIEDGLLNQVDLILRIKGMDKSVLKRTRQGTLRNDVMNIIGPEDLIAMKIFAGRHKDIDDVKGILKVSQELIDKKLLRTLTAHYVKKESKVLEELM